MILIAELFRTIVPKPKAPECSHADLSVIPSNVFGSPQNNVYHEFCRGWKKDSGLQMIVNAAGESDRPRPQMFKSVQSRAPPPNPDNWSEYGFRLGFNPASGGQECAVDCEETFSQFTRACRNSGSVGTVMAKSGKHDVGCGVFNYSIENRFVPLEVNERECHPDNGVRDHLDTLKGWVNDSFLIWGIASLTVIKRGDASAFFHWPSGNADVRAELNVYWEDGCAIEEADEISPINPLMLENPGDSVEQSAWCYSMMKENLTGCEAQNGGSGGKIRVGCLVYEFKATKA